MCSVSPALSIVVLNCNGIRHLPDCLGSIRDQEFKNYELIVVDNGSQDGSVEYIRANFPEAYIIENDKNEGFCRGANQGILKARGEYVLLLNNDTKLQNDYLRELMNCWVSAPDDVIGIFPVALYYDRPKVINSAGARWSAFRFWQPLKVRMLDDLGSNCKYIFGSIFIAPCFKREQFIKIGGFDEFFFAYGEDFDLSYRANILGYRFLMCPRLIIYHKMSQFFVDNAVNIAYFRVRYSCRNYLLVLIKNYELKNLVIFMPIFLLHCWFYNCILKNIWRFGIAAFPALIKGFLEAIHDLLCYGRYIKAQRKIIQTSREIKDIEVWRYR